MAGVDVAVALPTLVDVAVGDHPAAGRLDQERVAGQVEPGPPPLGEHVGDGGVLDPELVEVAAGEQGGDRLEVVQGGRPGHETAAGAVGCHRRLPRAWVRPDRPTVPRPWPPGKRISRRPSRGWIVA